MLYKIHLVVWLGRLGCFFVVLFGVAAVAPAPRAALALPGAPLALWAAGALGRARTLRWVTAGGIPPPAGGGCALGHCAASGAQPSPTEKRLFRKKKRTNLESGAFFDLPCSRSLRYYKIASSLMPFCELTPYLTSKDTGRAAHFGRLSPYLDTIRGIYRRRHLGKRLFS